MVYLPAKKATIYSPGHFIKMLTELSISDNYGDFTRIIEQSQANLKYKRI